MQRIAFLQEPTLWAMGVEHALQAFAHPVGSYKNKNIRLANKSMGNSNLIGPDQSQPPQANPMR